MAKQIPTRERAARALCKFSYQPPDILMGGQPMWRSYLPEVDAVLKAALSEEEWARVQKEG